MHLIPLSIPDPSGLFIQAVDHARIDVHEPQHETILALLRAAVDYVEGETKQQLFRARYALHLDGWPENGVITLPKPPLQDVDGVLYRQDGTDKLLPMSNYVPDPAGSKPGRVSFRGDLPALDDESGSVVIEFSCGYGDTPQALPPMLRQAVMLTFSHWFDHREGASDRTVKEVPLAVQSIVTLNAFPEVV